MIISLVGLIITCTVAWAALHVDQVTEQRLLQQQTKQAGSVLSSAVLLIQQPLVNALAVQSAAPNGMTTSAERILSRSVGTRGLFEDASIWQRRDGVIRRLVTVGGKPALSTTSAVTHAFLTRAFTKKTFTVTAYSVGQHRGIVYVLADPVTGYLVYAERPLPANRRAPVASDSAFSELHYAIYLGPAATASTLTTTDVNPATLPFKGTRASVTLPFGDTVLILTTSPHGHLGASLSRWLPVFLLIGGLFLTAGAVVLSRLLDERRRAAEEQAAIMTGMSERLQRALLPLKVPEVPQLEVAVEYVAGDVGVAVGGDWYSFIDLEPDSYGFVVGDVSGHGLDAVAVMARARFTLRAYLLRGDDPGQALSASSRNFDINEDGHLATCIVGVGNWRTGAVTVANAGHPRPLVVGGQGARFLDIATGPPLGTVAFSYETTSFQLSSGETLFCFTDGLIERRAEEIETGMERLATVVASVAAEPIKQVVDDTVQTMRSEQAEDDIAVLAFRWLGAP